MADSLREQVARIINSLNPTGGLITVSVPAMELVLERAILALVPPAARRAPDDAP